jgi:hypothetical protein
MLKTLIVIALAFSFVVCAHGEDHPPTSNPTEATNPAPVIAALASPENPTTENGTRATEDGKTKDEPKTVRIILPAKDDYDYWAFAINAVLAGVGLIGIGIGLGSLCILRKQTNHIVASERAWMAVQIGQLSFDEVMSPHLMPDSAHVSAIVLVTNEGKTPATVTQTWIDSFSEETVDSKDVPLVPKLPDHPDQMGSTKPITKRVASVYVPKQQFHLGCTLPKSELLKENSAWRSGAKCFCIVGFVKYIDAFKIPRITRFCFSYQALRGVPLMDAKTGKPVVHPEFVRDGPDIFNEMT